MSPGCKFLLFILIEMQNHFFTRIISADGHLDFHASVHSEAPLENLCCSARNVHTNTSPKINRSKLSGSHPCNVPCLLNIEICLDAGHPLPKNAVSTECEIGRLASTYKPNNDTFGSFPPLYFPFFGAWQPNFRILVRVNVEVDGLHVKPMLVSGIHYNRETEEPPRNRQINAKTAADHHVRNFNLVTVVPNTTITMQYQTVCNENFFGLSCGTYCRPQRGIHGNFLCDISSGKKLCLPGWSGERCNEAVCTRPCVHGKCIKPQYCKCENGWHGRDCGTCRVYPGCVNGDCEWNQTLNVYKPLTCVCRPGWGGMLCDIEVQFCERHLDACRNGGQCINTETHRNEFHKCVCLPGFWGTHCEFDCTSRGCDGRGNCEKQPDSKYKCICHPAYSGDFCQFNRTQWQVDDAPSELREAAEPESKKQHCSPYLCCNEGTCVEMEKRILCDCPQGYHRIECEKINESSPVMHSKCAIRYNARPQEFRELAFKQKQPNSLVYLGLSFLGIMTGVAILCISAFTVVWTCAGRRKRPILDAAAFAYQSVKNKLDKQKYQNPSSGKVMTALNKCGDELCTTDTLPSELDITQYLVTEVQEHNTLLYPIGSQFAVVHGVLQCKAKLAMIQPSTVVPNNELQKYHSPNMMDNIEKPKAPL